MKLSYRDKVVFIVVIVILILVAGFFLLIKPKFEEIDSAKYNLETIEKKRDEVDAKIATLPNIIKEMKDTAQEIGERQQIFMPEQAPYLNEKYIREDLFKNAGLRYVGMNTNYTSANTINRYNINLQHILTYDNKMTADLYNDLPQEVRDKYNGVKAPSYPNATIGVTSVTMNFETDNGLKKMYEVIDTIAGGDKTVILNNISLQKSETDAGNKDVGCNLTIYSINPLNVDKVMEETDKIDESAATPPAEGAE